MPESAPAPEIRKEGPGVTSEQMKEIASFFEAQRENPESKWLPLMADAHNHPDDPEAWNMLAMRNGMDFTGEQLKAALKGSEVLANAAEAATGGEDLEAKNPPRPKIKEDIEEDVDLSDLDKAA